MAKRSIWEELTPQQRKELKAYREEEYSYIPDWALRLHAPRKISDIDKELQSLEEDELRLLYNVIPDDQYEEALKKYINKIPYIPLAGKVDKEEVISAYMSSPESLMEGEYIYSICKNETAAKGHAFAISPKEYWGRVEEKVKTDISSFVGSRRERLLSAFLPIVEEALTMFFEIFVEGSPEAETYKKKVEEYGLPAVAEETLRFMEELSLNWEIAVYWDKSDLAEDIRSNPDLYLVFGFFLTLIEELRESIRAAICRRGNDYLQLIDKERILSDLKEYFTGLKEYLKN